MALQLIYYLLNSVVIQKLLLRFSLKRHIENLLLLLFNFEQLLANIWLRFNLFILFILLRSIHLNQILLVIQYLLLFLIKAWWSLIQKLDWIKGFPGLNFNALLFIKKVGVQTLLRFCECCPWSQLIFYFNLGYFFLWTCWPLCQFSRLISLWLWFSWLL